MTDKKFTQEQIIKAIKCCNEIDNMDCLQCPYFSTPYNYERCSNRGKDTLDLINYLTTTNKNYEAIIKRADELIDTLKAEIDELIHKLECLLCHATDGKLSKHTYDLKTMEVNVTDCFNESYNDGYNEAIKEFAERLKNKIISDTAYGCDTNQHTGYYDYQIKIGDIPEYIDNLVKEMTEVR